MNAKSGGKRRGRPPIPPEQRKRAPVQFRTTPDLRGRLDRAAEENGRSLAQEMELRLERSFEHEQIASSPEWYGTAILLVQLAQAVERRTGESAFKDWKTGFAVQSAWKKAAAYTFAEMPESMDIGDFPEKFAMDLPDPPETPVYRRLAPSGEIERGEAEHDAEMVKWQKEYREKHEKLLAGAEAHIEKQTEYLIRAKAALDVYKGAKSIGVAAFAEIFPEDK